MDFQQELNTYGKNTMQVFIGPSEIFWYSSQEIAWIWS